MVHTCSSQEFVLDVSEVPESSNCHGGAPRHAPCGAPPPPLPPPVSIKQLLAPQNELMRMLVENDARCGVGRSHTTTVRRWTPHTLTFWRHILQCSPGLLIWWRRITSSAPSSQSLGFYTARSIRSLCMQLNRFEVP
jgi:hypothetical protein